MESANHDSQQQERPHRFPSTPPPEAVRPNHGISINLPVTHDVRPPPPVKHKSDPDYRSPARHHRRVPSRSHEVKETLNARSHYGSSEDDGGAIFRINQYSIKQEIGRGSFGAVHLAADQYGNEYAVKEFSKSRLRKRAQSNLLRRPNQARRVGHLAAGRSFNSPMHRFSSGDKLSSYQDNNALNLIREEIAIMKKLDHSNLVSLIEVLDDPDEDSLYMVLEMCKKGVVMKVGLEERAAPYEDEACRCWFRDMILGIEYLHAQGIIHRDIKPDNCLITHDDVLKIVDFGVSEMFERESSMATAKSAGSPAFMPPELCVAKHGEISGRAADIWSMGVTLYCLRYGRIPFERTGMLELYDSIRTDPVPLDEEQDDTFKDLMWRLLEKDPHKRIAMEELREHPWVTKNGTDDLLPAEENCSDLVEPPTEAEMKHAITGKMGSLLVVMKAVRRFKALLVRKRPFAFEGMFGRDIRLSTPPSSTADDSRNSTFKYQTSDPQGHTNPHPPLPPSARPLQSPIQFEKPGIKPPPSESATPQPNAKSQASSDPLDSTSHQHPPNPQEHHAYPAAHPRNITIDDHAKGHAHDPLLDTLFLDIGVGVVDPSSDSPNPTNPSDLHGTLSQDHVVSESPTGVEENIYELAYQDEVKRLHDQHGDEANLHLNRRVEHREDLRRHPSISRSSRQPTRQLLERKSVGAASESHEGEGRSGLKGLIDEVRRKQDQERREQDGDARGGTAADACETPAN